MATDPFGRFDVLGMMRQGGGSQVPKQLRHSFVSPRTKPVFFPVLLLVGVFATGVLVTLCALDGGVYGSDDLTRRADCFSM